MSYNLKTFFLLVCMLGACVLPGKAQNTTVLEEPEREFREAEALFSKDHYNAARKAYEELANKTKPGSFRHVEAQYYVAASALRLYHNDGVALMKEFIRKHPTHALANRGHMELGKYYYRKEQYEKAASAFDEINPEGLKEETKQEIHFKAGYADFNLQNFKDAKRNFDEVKNTSHKYSYAASYYAGFIAYRRKNYEEAVEDLKRAGSHKNFRNVVPYMVANIYYKQGKYKALLNYSEKVLNRDKNVKNRDDIALLAGEALYKQERYEEAASYFSEYFKRHKNPDDGIVFRYAYSLYQAGDFENASRGFKKIAGEGDSLGQQASFYLGNTYIKTGEKQFALRAYENAAEGEVVSIKEEATFKTGKIYYEMADYQKAIETFRLFNKEFPESGFRGEIADMLPKAYLNTGNYGQAVDYIEKKIHKSAEIKRIYQKVAYYHGAQLYNNGKYKRAVEMFAKSLQYPYDQEISAASAYWKGEAFSIGKRYKDAINSYATVFQIQGSEETPYFLKSRYGIGFAYYNTKKFEDALRHFREYTEAAEPEEAGNRYTHALIRLADCYYVTKSYGKAVETYNRALGTGNVKQDYVYYQLGVVQSLRGNIEASRKHFQGVLEKFSSSAHYDDALFKMAKVDLDNGNYERALKEYTRLIEEKPESPLTPYAYRDRAICYRNLDRNKKALADNKTILQKFITHEAAKSAVQEIVSLDVEGKETDALLKQYRSAHPDDESLASVEYEAAKNQYYDQNYRKAIKKFRNYLETYSNNEYTQDAAFYLAESYNNLGQTDSAKHFYKKVRGGAPTVFRNRSVYSLAKLAYKEERHNDARKYYHELLEIARNSKEIFRGRRGLMKSYYASGKKDSALVYADKILSSDYPSQSSVNVARLYKARIYYSEKNMDQVKNILLSIINDSENETGAEANYMLAKIYHEEEQYKQSLQQCHNINDRYGRYSQWLGKSFLLIADNLKALGEDFQAKATLKSIIKHSPEEAIVRKAEKKLKNLQKDNTGTGTEKDTMSHEKDTLR